MDIDPGVRFSLERTLLSWIRTSIALMGLGFVLARFSPAFNGVESVTQEGDLSMWIGVSLILLGIFVNIAANVAFHKNIKRLHSGEPLEEGHWTLGRILSISLSLLGLMTVIFLILKY